MAKKILIIEDSLTVRSMIADALRSEGYEIIEAEDGEKGLEKAAEHLPDLVLLDITLPGMSGYDVLGEFRKDSKNAYLPIIMLTSKAGTESLLTAEKLGATDYMIKPIQLQELLDFMRKYV